MTHLVAFHKLAVVELNETAAYYESKITGLGMDFLDEIERSVEQIRSQPVAYPRIFQVIRRKILRRFPYSILYSIVGGQVRILAIASQKRRPLYWRGRM